MSGCPTHSQKYSQVVTTQIWIWQSGSRTQVTRSQLDHHIESGSVSLSGTLRNRWHVVNEQRVVDPPQSQKSYPSNHISKTDKTLRVKDPRDKIPARRLNIESGRVRTGVEGCQESPQSLLGCCVYCIPSMVGAVTGTLCNRWHVLEE